MLQSMLSLHILGQEEQLLINHLILETMEENNVTVEATPEVAPTPVANVAPATADVKTAKVLGANLKLTENKFEYFLLVLEGEQQGVAIWPNELEQLLQQDEAIAMSMLGFDKFCLVLKGAKVGYVTEGEGDQMLHVIKSIKIDDKLGIVAKAVEAFVQQMLS